MPKMKPRTLSGFMELLPAPQQQMERMMDILRTTYALYGFTPLDTPIIEDAQILLAKGGGETEKQIYRFQKGDSDLALRFDLTVPLAKYVALNYGRSARSTGASVPSGADSGSSIRRTSTSSAMRSWTSSMRRRSPPLSIRPLPGWALKNSRSG